jgi:hypothetical protein
MTKLRGPTGTLVLDLQDRFFISFSDKSFHDCMARLEKGGDEEYIRLCRLTQDEFRLEFPNDGPRYADQK